jgi:hypothetical protein
MFCTIL